MKLTADVAVKIMTDIALHQCQRDAIDTPRQFAMHELTCGKDSSHGMLFPVFDQDEGKVKLICPTCDYTQDNAAGFDDRY